MATPVTRPPSTISRSIDVPNLNSTPSSAARAERPCVNIWQSPVSSSGRRSALSPALRRFAVVGFLSLLGFAGFEATFSLWGKDQFGFTEGSASLVFVFVGGGAGKVAVERRIGGRTNSIARRFDRVCDVLTQLGYLDESSQVTDSGRLLMRLYIK